MTEPEEHRLAKLLAANEKEARDDGLKQVIAYLQTESKKSSDDSQDNLEKLWYGLWYCMWHSDKLPVQDQLAVDMAGLIYHTNYETDVGYLKAFVLAFFKINSREWQGLDRLRTSKFMRLIRHFYHNLLDIVLRSDSIESLMSFINEDVIQWRVTDRSGMKFYMPLGIRYHLGNIFIEELKNNIFGENIMTVKDFDDFTWTAEDQKKRFIDTDLMWQLLQPFVIVVLRTPNLTYRDQIIDNVFDVLLQESDVTVKAIANTPGIDKDEVKSLQNSPRLSFDFKKIAEKMFALSNDKSVIDAPIKQSNRTACYELVSRFRDCAANIVPVDSQTKDDIAFDRAIMNQKREKKKRNRLNRKRKRESEDNKDNMQVDEPKVKAKFPTKVEKIEEEPVEGETEDFNMNTDNNSEKNLVLKRKKFKHIRFTRRQPMRQYCRSEKYNNIRLMVGPRPIKPGRKILPPVESFEDNLDTSKVKERRLSWGLDRSLVKEFDKTKKLKYKVTDIFSPQKTPDRGILRKKSKYV